MKNREVICNFLKFQENLRSYDGHKKIYFFLIKKRPIELIIFFLIYKNRLAALFTVCEAQAHDFPSRFLV